MWFVPNPGPEGIPHCAGVPFTFFLEEQSSTLPVYMFFLLLLFDKDGFSGTALRPILASPHTPHFHFVLLIPGQWAAECPTKSQRSLRLSSSGRPGVWYKHHRGVKENFSEVCLVWLMLS